MRFGKHVVVLAVYYAICEAMPVSQVARAMRIIHHIRVLRVTITKWHHKAAFLFQRRLPKSSIFPVYGRKPWQRRDRTEGAWKKALVLAQIMPKVRPHARTNSDQTTYHKTRPSPHCNDARHSAGTKNPHNSLPTDTPAIRRPWATSNSIWPATSATCPFSNRRTTYRRNSPSRKR